ncbi:MAG: hypothetical protein M1830_004597 [Pleopsidium flavum]|nr:MAG: hypothetical protein M1830_004597 [Pleopsidium flavum]
MEIQYSVDQGPEHPRRAARYEVIKELRNKRQTIVGFIGKTEWGNRSYITQEADSDRPPPKKYVDLWIWPIIEFSSNNQVIKHDLYILGKLLTEIDDEWSEIVKLLFLTLDCFHGADRYTSTHISLPKDSRATMVKFVGNNLNLTADLLRYIDNTALATINEHITSSSFSYCLARIEGYTARVEKLMADQQQEGSSIDMSFTHSFKPVSNTIRQIVSSISWWIREVRKHETFRSDDRVLSKEAVEDVEHTLSHLCRSLGMTRRYQWVDEGQQRAAGHLIIVSEGWSWLERDTPGAR